MATFRVRAAVAKIWKDAPLHLHPEAVARVFATMPTAKTFNADLKRAKIPKEDALGRVVDLHSLRGTLATVLASRVAPAVAQRALRHAKSETTLRHYVSVEDVTVAKAIDAAATGTDGAGADSCQQCSQQSAPLDGVQLGAKGCEALRKGGDETGATANTADPVKRSGLYAFRDAHLPARRLTGDTPRRRCRYGDDDVDLRRDPSSA